MSRQEKATAKLQEVGGMEILDLLRETDPEYVSIVERYMYGEVYYHGSMDMIMREIVIICVLASYQTYTVLASHVKAALKVGATPAHIKEALYHCSPYIGIARVEEALIIVNKVFTEAKIQLPHQKQGTVSDDTRFDKGLEAQCTIFGRENMLNMRAAAPDNEKHIQDYLSAYCFGDFYTRGIYDLKQREVIVFAVLSSMGTEPQLQAHVGGNVAVGNDKALLINALTQILPYIGFPRFLNALRIVNTVIPEPKK